ncbi:MAG: rhodanese-like domain-containing protein [Alphaproteobacteria bacterium]
MATWRDRLNQGEVAVLDVRGHDDFIGPLGHIPQAENIPFDEIDRHIEALSQGSGSLIFACRTFKRSAKAAEILKNAGGR